MVELDLAEVGELLKRTPKRYVVPPGLVSGLLLFAPEAWLEPLGVAGLRDGWPQPYLGAVFLLSCALLVCALGVDLWDSVVARRDEHRRTRVRKERLATLTAEEKRLLRRCLEDDPRSGYPPQERGVVEGLERGGVVYRSVPTDPGNVGPAYNIRPWAQRHLRDHPELLAAEDEGG